ncbi:Alpha/Beta hydrolase protein [Microdochium bolleyi]|uniref:Alpha/Beta hydrolase protein n=1 Tax=Microdochium bolleyi TaxID=196109 RepID=A0A136IZ18_9PEZI|nr:Alpha/Beta hydrolase protein [Microdochium bolleyi]
MYDTKEEIEALAHPTDPGFDEYFNGPDKHPMLSVPFKDVASFWAMNPQTPQLPDTPTEYTVKAPLRDGHESEVRVYKPRRSSSTTKDPLVVLIHGGGFALGHWSHIGTHARALAHLLGVTAVSIAYRLAPAHKFPQAPRDVWDTLSWLTSDAGLAALGSDVDPTRGFVVGGISAGANLATVAVQNSALLAAEDAAEKLRFSVTGLWTSIPVYYEAGTVPEKYRHLWTSRGQNAKSAVIDADAITFVKQNYGYDASSPEYCPGYGTEGAAATMPPTYIQVAGQDPLRDDGIVFEKVLREAGVKTRLDAYKGVPHGFAELTEIPLAWKNRVDMLKGFGWLLGKEEASEEQCREAWKVATETATAPGGGA